MSKVPVTAWASKYTTFFVYQNISSYFLYKSVCIYTRPYVFIERGPSLLELGNRHDNQAYMKALKTENVPLSSVVRRC